MEEMLVMVPSRTRPQNISRLIGAWADTDTRADLLILIDDDDPELDGYRALKHLTAAAWGKQIAFQTATRQRIGPRLNGQWARFTPYYDVVGFMGDDHLPITPQWDQRILEASTPWTVVYGNDLLQGERLASAAFLGSQLLDNLGWFALPGCDHLYLDNAWMTVGHQLGTLRYLPDVIIEHLHPYAGKASEDPLYREVNDPAMYSHDQAAYNAWVTHGWIQDIARVKAAMQP